MTTTGWTSPEITTFVDEVRIHLADLTTEQRDDLLDGLDADLADQLADGAVWADLGDARSYAVELRRAAGLPEATRRLPRLRMPSIGRIELGLDRSHDWFEGLVDDRAWRRSVWDVVSSLRPAWWLARAWIAVTLLDVSQGPAEPVSVVPSLAHPLLGPVVLTAAVVVSVLIGLGRWWPGSAVDSGSPVAGRLVLLGLNAAAILAPLAFTIPNPGYIDSYDRTSQADDYSTGYRDARRELIQSEARSAALRVGLKQVTNVFAYDVDGQLLTGVQLFDQDGDPVTVGPRAGTGRGLARFVPCPRLNGTTPLYNVFPLDQVRLRTGFCEPDTASRASAVPPLAKVPALP